MELRSNKYDKNYLNLAHKGSSCHKEEILRADLCGCFYCKETFTPFEIEEWIDEGVMGETAVCPKCNIDSVLTSKFPIDDELFLSEMHYYWFSK